MTVDKVISEETSQFLHFIFTESLRTWHSPLKSATYNATSFCFRLSIYQVFFVVSEEVWLAGDFVLITTGGLFWFFCDQVNVMQIYLNIGWS